MAKNSKSNNEMTEDLTSTENFLDRNRKTLLSIGVIIIAVLVGYIGYQKMILEPKNQESQEVIWNAFYDLENDSIELAAAGTDDYLGLEEIADEYNGTSGGEMANYSMALIEIRRGDFEAALNYLNECDFSDVMLGSICIGLKGDCYVELGDYSKAVGYFEDAASIYPNEFTSPMYLIKGALVYEELGEKSKAHSMYKQVKENYEKTDFAENIDMYIGRTKS